MPSVLHLLVEENIALGHGPTVKAMTRLRGSGFSRHEALCAIGGALWPVLSQQGDQNQLQLSQDARMNQALNQLHAVQK